MKAKIFSSFFGRMEDSDSRGSEPDDKHTVMDLTNNTVTRISPHLYSNGPEHNTDGVLRVLSNATIASPSSYRTVIQHSSPQQLHHDQTLTNSGSLMDNSMITTSGSNSPTLSIDPYRSICVPSPGSLAGSSQLSALQLAADRKTKKQPQPIPEECKDDAYWERRKRNNESAKRSRELRRMKEHHTSVRVVHLEQENLQLRTEVSMLREEVEKLREMLCSKSSNNR